MIKQKQGKANIVADGLSRRHTLLSMLETKFLSFDHIKELYEKDDDFAFVYGKCHQGEAKTFIFPTNISLRVKSFTFP